MKTKLWLSLCLVVIACNQPSAPEKITPNPISQFSETGFVEFYSETAAIESEGLVKQSNTLPAAVTRFLTEPNEDNLHGAQLAWLNTHLSFLKASFYLSESARKTGLSAAEASEPENSIYLIDAWPIQEGFLDSLQLYPNSGIINDLTLSIDERTLRSQHGITYAEEVSLGFHAIEFLLWSRPITDYTVVIDLTDDQDSDGLNLSQLSNNRRREALRLITQLLHDDIIRQYRQPHGEGAQLSATALYSLIGAIRSCTSALQNIQRELVLIANDASSGHSRFSHSSIQDLLTRMQTLVFVYADPGRLHQQFESLDPILADQFHNLMAATLQGLSELTDADVDQSKLGELNSRLDIMIDHIQQLEYMVGS